jgi:hypothetical protein
VLLALPFVLSCSPETPETPAISLSQRAWSLPPVGVDWDYQLGGAAEAAPGVGIVVRDREAAPLGKGYDVCYVNGFQTQPDERAFWRSEARWPLVLKRAGRPVVDTAWGEWLLDIRTDANRRRLARIVGGWVDRCADDGYDAVELDNLDSFSRSHGLLTAAQARSYARLLVARAHDAGLAVAQKNWAELGPGARRIGFDFAIAEECARWRECDEYAAVHGRRVLVVEYRRADFDRACRGYPALPVVLRDRGLAPGGLRDWC